MRPSDVRTQPRLFPNDAWSRDRQTRLTVILPCYNYADFLPDAMASVIDQKVDEVELIVLNDGSKDASLEVALKLADLFRNFPILVIDQENQGQPAISRNNAIRHANGDLILPLDADDLLAEGAIRALMQPHLEANGEWVVSYGSMKTFGTKDGGWQTVPFDPNAMLRRNQIPYCAMYPRALWEANGGYSENVPGYEDWDFWVGAVTLGARFQHLPVVHLLYRETSVASMMDRGQAKHEYNIAGIISNHPHAFEDEEVAWARHFRGLFPVPPSRRGFYGLDALYPRAALLLIGFYPELFPEEKVKWAEGELRRNQLTLRRGVQSPKRTQLPEIPAVNGLPVYKFLEAQAAFAEDEVEEAERWMEEYRREVDYDGFARTDNRPDGTPAVSVIVVAWKTNRDLLACLDSLAAQDDADFEVIVVDNGGNGAVDAELAKRPILHIQSPANMILSEGRNIGAHFARGNVLAMLDDDAIVPANYIASIRKAFRTYDIVAFRGKVLPKSDHRNNGRAEHYDFGPIALPSPVDTEGNSAWRADVWREMNGMHPLLFGHEGTELSWRITRVHGEEKVIYWPGTAIFHDYAASDDKLNEKSARHTRMKAFLHHLHPQIDSYIQHVRRPLFVQGGREQAEKLIPRKETPLPLHVPSNPSLISRSRKEQTQASTP